VPLNINIYVLSREHTFPSQTDNTATNNLTFKSIMMMCFMMMAELKTVEIIIILCTE
jgi:hypothetical protein